MWVSGLSVAAIVAPILIGALFSFVVALRWPRQMPREVEKPELSARELGAAVGFDWMHRWSQFAQKWLWLLFLPAVASCLFLLWAVSFYLVPVIPTNSYDLLNVFGYFVIVWLVFIFWRVRFGLPRSQRGAVYAGFFAFRRVLAWTLPLSLWLLIFALWGGVAARAQAETDLQQFLASENRMG
jgi:hypothetical protein